MTPLETPARPATWSRRRILEILAASASGVVFTGILVPIGAYLVPPDEGGGREGELMLVCRADELPAGQAKVVLHGSRPVLVIHTTTGWIGLSALCPHLGCAVRWEPSREVIECPCHGARFDPQGRVLSGPTPGPLTPVAVRQVGDKVFVAGS